MKGEKHEEGTTITITVEDIKTAIDMKIDENFQKVNGLNIYWDSLLETYGFSDDFRRQYWSSVKSVKEIPQVALLSQLLKQLKEAKGIVETKREALEKIKAQTQA